MWLSLVAQQFKKYKYIPITYIIDGNYDLLPPSSLKERLPEASWKDISMSLLNFITRETRTKCKKACTFSGNYKPLANPIFLITNPNRKGCKEIASLMDPREFNPKHWSNFEKFSQEYNLSPEDLKNQIIKSPKTSKLIEAKDLQYKILRKTCITNEKLFHMTHLSSLHCSICKFPSQNSTHRFFYAPA